MYILICTIRAYVLKVPHVEHKVLLRGTPECWIALQQKRLIWFELLEPSAQLFLSLLFHKWHTPFQQTDAVLYEMSIKSPGGASERRSVGASERFWEPVRAKEKSLHVWERRPVTPICGGILIGSHGMEMK